MLQIDPMQFLIQATALVIVVCAAAAVYALVEKWLGINQENRRP